MSHGYTLIETVIAMAIVAILATIALPGYQGYRLKTARSTGGGCLIEAQQRVESVYQHTFAYPADLVGAGYGASSASCGDQRLYTLTLSQPNTAGCPSATCFRLLATAQGSQAGDGDLRLTYDARNTDPAARSFKEHRPPTSASWLPSWDFQPGH